MPVSGRYGVPFTGFQTLDADANGAMARSRELPEAIEVARSRELQDAIEEHAQRPTTLDAIRSQARSRVEQIRRELADAEAKRAELETLEKMLAVLLPEQA